MSGASGSAFRPWMLVPGCLALIVMALFFMGLQRDDARDLPSALIDRPAPEFDLAALRDGQAGLSTEDLKMPGVKLVNIWASWCGPCRVEHPQIEALAAEGVTIHGINYKDNQANAEQFLAELGDPYSLIGADITGRAGIEWGVYGVPETFVIDGSGNVIYKHIGPILPEQIETKIRPAIKAAAGQS
ncbi:MAG: DsbE family thiol:disulfide interchange protein [Pseudomonadota bacterium]